MIIYEINNTVNNKKYIGLTTRSLQERWRYHQYVARRKIKQQYLHKAMAKHGIENFSIKKIYEASSISELKTKEQQLIEQLNTLVPNGYNLTTGGEHPKHNEYTKQLQSEARKKYMQSPQNRERLSKINTGKTLPENIKQKISTSLKKHYKHNKNARYGKKHSEETRAKMSASHKGRIFSSEHKRKLSEAGKGNSNMQDKKHSEETRAKMRQSQLERRTREKLNPII